MLRCSSCGKLLAEVITPPYRIACVRCKTVNEMHLQRSVKTPILTS
jgi:phage FluMu protein Com